MEDTNVCSLTDVIFTIFKKQGLSVKVVKQILEQWQNMATEIGDNSKLEFKAIYSIEKNPYFKLFL